MYVFINSIADVLVEDLLLVWVLISEGVLESFVVENIQLKAVSLLVEM